MVMMLVMMMGMMINNDHRLLAIDHAKAQKKVFYSLATDLASVYSPRLPRKSPGAPCLGMLPCLHRLIGILAIMVANTMASFACEKKALLHSCSPPSSHPAIHPAFQPPSQYSPEKQKTIIFAAQQNQPCPLTTISHFFCNKPMSLLANESLAPPPQRPVLRLIAPFRTRRTKVLAVLACLSLVYLFVLASVPALRMDPGPLAQEQAEAIAAAQAHGPRWTKMPDLSMLSSNNKNMDSQEGDRVTENQPESEALTLETKLEQLISTHPIMVFSKSYCPYSAAAKKLLRSYTDAVQVMEVDLEPQSDEIKQILTRITHGHSTFPSVFLDGVSIGGSDSLHALDTKGELALAIVRMGVPMKVDRG